MIQPMDDQKKTEDQKPDQIFILHWEEVEKTMYEEMAKEIREHSTLSGIPCRFFDDAMDMMIAMGEEQENNPNQTISTLAHPNRESELQHAAHLYGNPPDEAVFLEEVMSRMEQKDLDEYNEHGTINGLPAQVFSTLEEMADYLRDKKKKGEGTTMLGITSEKEEKLKEIMQRKEEEE